MDELTGERVGWAAVVVNYNSAFFLDSCLRSLFACDLRPSEVVVVDNASNDDSLLELQSWPEVVVEQNEENLGFAGGANLGISLTTAPVVVVLNPDVEVDRTFGRAVVRLFNESPKLGIAGAKLRYPGGDTIQHAGGILHRPLLTTAHYGHGEPDDGQWDRTADVDFVTGGAMALRREAFDAVGGFDESFWPAYYEDVDLSFRMRSAGWSVRYEPVLTAVHVESVTLGQSPVYFRLFHRNRFRFALKHLPSNYWWGRFMPAEADRLRGELSAVTDADWPVRSGGEAIEQLARAGYPLDRGEHGLLDGLALSDAIGALNSVRETRIVRPEPPPPPPTLLGRILHRLRRPGSRQMIDELSARQQAFNDAVVKTLEAQDRQNREQVTELLLTMLSVGYLNLSSQYDDDQS